VRIRFVFTVQQTGPHVKSQCAGIARYGSRPPTIKQATRHRPPARGGPTIYDRSTSGTNASYNASYIVGPPLAGGLPGAASRACFALARASVNAYGGGLLDGGWPAWRSHGLPLMPMGVACLMGGWPASRSHGLPLMPMGVACLMAGGLPGARTASVTASAATPCGWPVGLVAGLHVRGLCAPSACHHISYTLLYNEAYYETTQAGSFLFFIETFPANISWCLWGVSRTEALIYM